MKRKTAPARVAPPVEDGFAEIVHLIETARQRAYQAVNTTLIDLYWQVGEFISKRLASDGWGKGTIEALAMFIRRTEPGIRDFSSQNLWRMQQSFETYRAEPILSPPVRELPWTHNLIILTQSKRAEQREFFLRMAIREKSAKRELERQFKASLFEPAVLSLVKLSTALREIHPQALPQWDRRPAS